MTNDALPSVVMFPDNSDRNPYQRELLSSLERRGVEASAEPAPWWFPLVRGWLVAGRPDVVHLHWIAPYIGTSHWPVAALLGLRTLVELVLLRVAGVTLVWTVHNLHEHERRNPRLDHTVRMAVARLSNRIIIHCDEVKRQVVTTYRLSGRHAAKIETIPHGHFIDAYPSDTTAAAARGRLGIDPEATVLCYFGLIRRYKNVPRLIEAFRAVDAPNTHLLVVGSPWNDGIEAAIEAAVAGDERVTTELAFVPDESIQHFLLAADAVVLPFDTILTSGSAILAMSFGRALVIPDVGCPAALIEPAGGVVYDPDVPDGLERAIETAVDPGTDLDAMGSRNRRVAERLDWDAIADALVEVYRGGVADPPRAVSRQERPPATTAQAGVQHDDGSGP